MKVAFQVLHWLYAELWRKPKEIRGVLWTLVFYVQALLGFSIASIVCPQKGGVWLLLGYTVVTMAMNHLNQKPRRLGRPLPYRRRR